MSNAVTHRRHFSSYLNLFSFVRENEIAQELARTKQDNAGLDEQLLEAIQQKIELSEQLEAWQVRHKCMLGRVE